MPSVVEIGAASRKQPGMRFVQASLNGTPVAVAFPPSLVRAGNVVFARDTGVFYIRVAGPGGAVPAWTTLGGGGGAPLSNNNPLDVGTTGAGTGTSASRDDHVHAHGNQTGATLHAVATPVSSGFMSAADKANLDAIVAAFSPPPVFSGPAGMTVGTAIKVVAPGPNMIAKASAASHILPVPQMPCSGFIATVVGPGQYTIYVDGQVLSGVFGALVAGDIYYVGLVPGTITNNVSAYVYPNVVQRIGVAISTTDLLVSIGSFLVADL